MSTVWVHPDASKVDRWYVRYSEQQVAWVTVKIFSHDVPCMGVDMRVGLVQRFIDGMRWKGMALNNWRGQVTENVVWQNNNCKRKLKPGANGLLEYSGGSVIVIWQWDQVLQWLAEGWPSTHPRGDVTSSIGTWCFMDGVDPVADHISRDPYTGWPHAMKQMRTIGIPPEVRRLERPITEHEIIDGLCGALKKHRVKLNQLHA